MTAHRVTTGPNAHGIRRLLLAARFPATKFPATSTSDATRIPEHCLNFVDGENPQECARRRQFRRPFQSARCRTLVLNFAARGRTESFTNRSIFKSDIASSTTSGASRLQSARLHYVAEVRLHYVPEVRLHGIGFILIQTPKSGAKRVIECGSRSLAPAETNYATIELETLAISWAIHKCDFYLKGMQHFEVCTDHRPLLGTFSKPLSRVDNPGIVRLREKVLDYNFSIAWVAGKENIIADALSRSVPKTQPVPHCLCAISPTSNTPILMATIIEHANSCPTYFKIKEALSNNKHPSSLPPDHPARGLREVWHELSVSEEGLLIVGGTRVFIPIPLRAGILKLLHKGHTGLQKTWATAKSLYFWPHMRTHLQQEIGKCEPCQSLKPSLPKEPLIHTTARFPMERASADLFQFGSQHYLVLVDRYSGLPMVNKLRNLSSATVIRVLTELFDTYGWPLSLRTDGGPQFRSEFRAFCVAHDIRHELSSPYHPESNGHAESAVKNVKHLMEKVKPSEFPAAFAAWKNTRRADQPSPNELFFGRQLRIQLPLMSSTLWQAASTQRAPPADPVRFRTLPPLSPGRTVWVQNPHTKRWTTKATVLSTSSTGRTYTLRTEEDKTITRNRRFIRPRYVDHLEWNYILVYKLRGGMFGSLYLSIYISISMISISIYLRLIQCRI